MSEEYLPKFPGAKYRLINAEYCDYGNYAAGDNGIIYSCAKSPFWSPLNISTARNGYASITLYKSQVKKTFYVHELILEAFQGKCPAGMECCHGSLGKLENKLSNLYYGTKRSNNYEDKYRDGTMLTGERHPRTRLTDNQVREVRKLYSEGNSYREIAKIYIVDHKTIWEIIKGKTYRDVN